MRIIILVLFISFCFTFCHGPSGRIEPSKKENKRFVDKFNIFVSSTELEELGFEHLESRSISILFCGDEFYLLNRKDQMVAKFLSNRPVNKYKRKGQGPGEFLNPENIFLYDSQTVAIYDGNKRQILFFDRDLNYLKQQSLNRQIAGFMKAGSMAYCTGYFGKKVFAILDQDFAIQETFRDAPPNNKGDFFRFFHYRGYLFPNKTVAATTWILFDPVCSVDIIDVLSKKTLFTLKWKNHHPVTQKELDERKNWYSSYKVGKYGSFYVAQNYFNSDVRDLSSGQIYDLIVFSHDGTLLSRFEDVDWLIVPSLNYQEDTRIFFMDDDGNLCYWDLKEFVHEQS